MAPFDDRTTTFSPSLEVGVLEIGGAGASSLDASNAGGGGSAATVEPSGGGGGGKSKWNKDADMRCSFSVKLGGGGAVSSEKGIPENFRRTCSSRSRISASGSTRKISSYATKSSTISSFSDSKPSSDFTCINSSALWMFDILMLRKDSFAPRSAWYIKFCLERSPSNAIILRI